MAIVRKARFSGRAAKEIGRLDIRWKERVADAVEDLAVDALLGKKLKGEFEGLRSFRLGRYRLIYRFTTDFLEIAFFSDRKDAYR